MKTAIAIIAIGEKYQKMWTNIFAPAVQAYAERHDYEILLMCEPLDPNSSKPPQWQKLLIPSEPAVKAFDRIVYLDTDIMCNPDAPGIAESVPDGKVGAVTWQGSYFADPVDFKIFQESWKCNETKWIREAKIESFADLLAIGGYPRNEDWLNSGVLVYQPTDEIAELFKALYDDEPHTEFSASEQQCLTHALCGPRNDLLHPIDRRFNRIWYLLKNQHYPFIEELHDDSFISSKCIEAALRDNYFIHFCAEPGQKDATRFMRHQHLLGTRTQAAVT